MPLEVKAVLAARGVGKVVKSGASDLVILRDIDLAVMSGEVLRGGVVRRAERSAAPDQSRAAIVRELSRSEAGQASSFARMPGEISTGRPAA